MAKLFIQDLPTKDELQASVTRVFEQADGAALYTNLLFMKVANELENQLDTLLAPHNLSVGRFTLLYLLHDSPEGLMPSELSLKVGVTQATISGLLNGLEKAEFVRRELHQNDGRSFVIKITEKGENLLRDVFPLWTPKVSQFWGRLNEAELATFRPLLEKIIHGLDLLKN